jgi:hypothetical protein
VNDPAIPALEKLNRYFESASQWKIAQKEYMLAIFRVWYADENAIMRQKMSTATIQRMGPVISQIVKQGIGEGTFSTPFPDQSGEVLLSLMVSYADVMAAKMIDLGLANLRPPPENFTERFEAFLTTLRTYSNAMERILGAPDGSIMMINTDTLMEWFPDPPPATPPIPAQLGGLGG